jgi:4-amino-4-deoxy-L-arabinose transferase-like glycosyltransferase
MVAYALSFTRAAETRPGPPLPVLAWLLAIIVLATALRLPGIEARPANISIDELLPGLEAARIARGGAPNVFSSVGWFAMPSLSFAFAAVVMRLAGHETLLPLRMSSLVMGVGGIACTFLLARRLLGDRVALLASFFMAASFWHIHNSRTGFPFVQSPFCTALVMYLLVRARQDRSRAMLAVAGLGFGLAVQCYFPVRILAVLVPLLLMMDWIRARASVRSMVAEGSIVAVGALLALAPLLVSVGWSKLTEHSREVLLTDPGVVAELSRLYRVDGLPAVFRRNLVEAASMFTDWADVAVLNRSPAGLLDMGTLAALAAGTLVAVLQGRAYSLLLVAWAALVFVFGVAFTGSPRASYRLAAAMPALFILAGLGVDWVMLDSAPARRWYRVTVRAPLLLGLAAWVVVENYQLFFVDYFKGDGHETIHGVALRFMASHCDGRQFYFISRESPGSEVSLFCPAFRVLEPAGIPAGVDATRPATFMVTKGERAALDWLRECYPAAAVSEHHAADGRFLFTRVDVDVDRLAMPPPSGRF